MSRMSGLWRHAGIPIAARRERRPHLIRPRRHVFGKAGGRPGLVNSSERCAS
jgi:hypothetical protein